MTGSTDIIELLPRLAGAYGMEHPQSAVDKLYAWLAAARTVGLAVGGLDCCVLSLGKAHLDHERTKDLLRELLPTLPAEQRDRVCAHLREDRDVVEAWVAKRFSR